MFSLKGIKQALYFNHHKTNIEKTPFQTFYVLARLSVLFYYKKEEFCRKYAILIKHNKAQAVLNYLK